MSITTGMMTGLQFQEVEAQNIGRQSKSNWKRYVCLYNACYSMPGTPALPLDLMETGQSVDSYVGLTLQQLLGDYVLDVYDLLL